eukprot:COSAG02_NODE_1797_length_10902_cov_25.030177_7_plen_204_part_00
MHNYTRLAVGGWEKSAEVAPTRTCFLASVSCVVTHLVEANLPTPTLTHMHAHMGFSCKSIVNCFARYVAMYRAGDIDDDDSIKESFAKAMNLTEESAARVCWAFPSILGATHVDVRAIMQEIWALKMYHELDPYVGRRSSVLSRAFTDATPQAARLVRLQIGLRHLLTQWHHETHTRTHTHTHARTHTHTHTHTHRCCAVSRQ